MESIETLAKLNINDIEQLTEQEAAEMAEEKIVIKDDYNCYFIDFGGYFGYSVCVFADGQHIHYANDYQLHHRYMETREELREWYVKTLNSKLYTTEEMNTVTDYDDYTRKDYFLRSYYSMRRPYISAFGIFRNAKDEAEHSRKTAGKIFSPVSYAYYDDADFVKELSDLREKLEQAKAESSYCNKAYWKTAFLSEMYNHEYGINNQGDLDVINCFANVWDVRDYWDISSLFKAAKFTELQKSAYMEARAEYYKETEDWR